MLRAALVTVLLLLAAAAPARADFTTAVDTPRELFPTGFAGDGVLVNDLRGVLLVRPGGTRRVLRTDRLWSAVGSGTRVAAYVGTESFTIANVAHADGPPYQPSEGGVGQNPFTIVAGGVGEPLREIARCGERPRVAVVPAVVAGDAVAWRDCDARAVAVDVGGRKARIDSAGTVVALASDGTRLVWITARDGAPALLERADPVSGERTVLGQLPALGTAPDVELRASSTGRIRATFTADQGGSEEPRCDLFDTAGGPPVASPSHDCAWRDITASPGSVGPTTARLRREPTRIVARDELGASRLLVQGRRGAEPQFAVADDRVALASRTCTGHTITDTTIGTAPPAAPLLRCPVRLRSRRARVDRRGRVAVRLACPRGCDAVQLSARGVVRSVAAPGRTRTVRLILSRRARAALRAGGSLRLRLDAFGPDGRTRALGRLAVRR